MAATKTSASRTIVTEDYVEALKRRVETLEKKLLPLDRTLPVIPLTNAVKDLEKKLDNLGSKEKSGDAKNLWEKTRQLEDTISPEYVQSLKMTEGAKAELLCGQVDQLKQFSDRMEEVHQLKDYINSTECQGLEAHERNLSRLAAVHLEQEDCVSEIAQQSRDLMEGYRKLMLQLSAQCVQWDESLRQYEASKT